MNQKAICHPLVHKCIIVACSAAGMSGYLNAPQHNKEVVFSSFLSRFEKAGSHVPYTFFSAPGKTQIALSSLLNYRPNLITEITLITKIMVQTVEIAFGSFLSILQTELLTKMLLKSCFCPFTIALSSFLEFRPNL